MKNNQLAILYLSPSLNGLDLIERVWKKTKTSNSLFIKRTVLRKKTLLMKKMLRKIKMIRQSRCKKAILKRLWWLKLRLSMNMRKGNKKNLKWIMKDPNQKNNWIWSPNRPKAKKAGLTENKAPLMKKNKIKSKKRRKNQ